MRDALPVRATIAAPARAIFRNNRTTPERSLYADHVLREVTGYGGAQPVTIVAAIWWLAVAQPLQSQLWARPSSRGAESLGIDAVTPA